jgi:carboxymethylenebutenolidase
MRAIADDHAARGMVAIAPDLYWRQEPGVRLDPGNSADRERAVALMNGLDEGLALDDALAAAGHVRGLGNGKVGVVGYCLGGKLAYLLAARPGIDAAVSYYGVAIQGALDRASAVRCPLLLHIAGEDHLCPPQAQVAIRDALAPFRDKITILEHPGVSHGFARRGAAMFDEAAAERADQATARFLDAALVSTR